MNKIIILLISTIIFFSCNNKADKADAYGNFEAIETIISSEANGKLLSFDLNEGVEYRKGMDIGLIDTTDLHLKKTQAVAQKNAVSSKINNINAQLNVQNEQLNTIENEELRLKKLIAGDAATSKQMDDLLAKKRLVLLQIKATKTQIKSVYSEIEVINKQIDQIDHLIKKCYLKIPLNGTILNKYVEPFELLIQGKAIYKIADLSKVILRIYVSGSQLQEIKLNQNVKVFIDKNEKENIDFEGNIIWISETAEFTPKIIQTKEERVDLVYAVKVLVKNNGQIKIGMPGEVLFNSKK